MAPSHGFAAASYREAALRGVPASHGETAFRGAAGLREARTLRWSERDSNRRSLRDGKGYGAPLQASLAVLGPEPVSGSASLAAVSDWQRREEPFAGAGPMVRIRFPPAESPRLTGFCPPTARSRLFRAGVWVRQVQRGQQRRVSRGAWRRPAGMSLSGQIPVPRPRCGGGLMNSDRAQAKPSTDRCSCQASGRRECASSLSAVKSRG